MSAENKIKQFELAISDENYYDFNVWFYQWHQLQLKEEFFPKRLISFYNNYYRNMSTFSHDLMLEKFRLNLFRSVNSDLAPLILNEDWSLFHKVHCM